MYSNKNFKQNDKYWKYYIFNLNIIKFSEVKLTPKICADGKES